MRLKLPKVHRPDRPYKKCQVGIDLPAAFIADLKSIDTHLYPVWHQYKVLWDSPVTNEYSQGREIHYAYGHLNFGFVPKDRKGAPVEEGAWHIWELCPDRGWGHVCKLESIDRSYLQIFLNRLHIQLKWNNKYGKVGMNSYQKYLDQLDEESREKVMKEREEMMNAIQEENEWLVNAAMQNFKRGKVKPTNPNKSQIISYPGQRNRSRIERPLDDSDRESGLITPGR